MPGDDPFNPVRATPDPAPVVRPRKVRRGARGRKAKAGPHEQHVGEVDPRGAFGVMYDSVTSRPAHTKPPEELVPETKAKRARRQMAQRPADLPSPHTASDEPGHETPPGGTSAKS